MEDPNKAAGTFPGAAQGSPPAGENAGQPTPGAETGGAGTVPEKQTVPLAVLMEEKSKRQALQDELSSLRAQVASMTSAPPQYPQNAPNAPVDIGRQLDELYETDPRKALQTEILTAFAWRDMVDAVLDEQLSTAKEKHTDFSNYEGKIKGYLRKLPLGQRSQSGVVELAYFAVKGQDVDNLIKSERERLIEKIRKGEDIQGFTTGTMTSTPSSKGTQLTEDELKVADALGITPEEYLKHKRK